MNNQSSYTADGAFFGIATWSFEQEFRSWAVGRAVHGLWSAVHDYPGAAAFIFPLFSG